MPAKNSRPDVCIVWKDVSYSAKSDTRETVQEIREQNARRDTYCGK